ncbi:MAG: ABC transporter substrate-binding protein, partial [Rhodospirillales bacterium]|nr:ABC transporter substrate-binding protein [Rhodospirillales bacterium]
MRDALKVYAPLVLLVIAGFAVAAYFIRPAPPTSIRMATGSDGGAYAAFGEQYKAALAVDGIDVQLVPSEGSLANLQLLSREEDPVDVAFVQGGVGDRERYPHLVSLASLYPEPVWLFIRSAKAPSSTLDLNGLRMAIGADGSGSSVFAEGLLSTLGVSEEAVKRIAIGGA